MSPPVTRPGSELLLASVVEKPNSDEDYSDGSDDEYYEEEVAVKIDEGEEYEDEDEA